MYISSIYVNLLNLNIFNISLKIYIEIDIKLDIGNGISD